LSAQAEGSESKYPQQKRKIAADEAEVNSAEQDAFISAQILLSEEGLNAADAASRIVMRQAAPFGRPSS
jgi:hypothetical protein